MTEAERLAKARKSVMSTHEKEARLEEWKKTPNYKEGQRLLKEYNSQHADTYSGYTAEQIHKMNTTQPQYQEVPTGEETPELRKIIKDYEAGPRNEHMDAGLKLLYEDFKKKDGK